MTMISPWGQPLEVRGYPSLTAGSLPHLSPVMLYWDAGLSSVTHSPSLGRCNPYSHSDINSTLIFHKHGSLLTERGCRWLCCLLTQKRIGQFSFAKTNPNQARIIETHNSSSTWGSRTSWRFLLWNHLHSHATVISLINEAPPTPQELAPLGLREGTCTSQDLEKQFNGPES